MSTEEFWKGDFGNQYTERNVGRVEINRQFMTRALMHAGHFGSLVELGAGSGENLRALNALAPSMELAGVEINDTAFGKLSQAMRDMQGDATKGCYHESLLHWAPGRQYDVAMTKGVLIHMAPDMLEKALDKLYQASSRYILIAEYYSPALREIPYRGHAGKMWAADYGGMMLDRYQDLNLVDVGFHYHRTTGQDDLTHWLLEKYNA